MYSLNIRDHIMIAHSFRGERFGPAQKLHGATYVVDATFERPQLDNDGMVVDIGLASKVLNEILELFNYRNLDEMKVFEARNSTTEAIAKEIFDRLAGAIGSGKFGEGASGVTSISVTLSESHIAWGRYEGRL